MAGRVCVDASVLLSILLKDDFVEQSKQLWRGWIEDDTALVSAPLFFAEVTSVLRHRVYLKRLSPEQGEDAVRVFLGIEEVTTPPVRALQPASWELAKQFNQPRAYDAQYLAAARYYDCEMWTADKKLVNAVSASWVRWLGDFQVP